MIRQISIENFKSLQKINLELGPLNIFIGTNASGKSNFFDALRVLQGFAYGFTVHEILDGKPKSSNSEVWDSIRGGSAQATYINGGDTNKSHQIRFEVNLSAKENNKPVEINYSIGFLASRGYVCEERLYVNGKDIYNSNPETAPLITNQIDSPTLNVKYYKGNVGKQPHLSFEKTRSIASQLLRHKDFSEKHLNDLRVLNHELANMQRIDPYPSILRSYSQAHSIGRMGEHGENFAALVRAICDDPKRKSAYLTWLKELRPTEVDDVGTLTGAVGEPMFNLLEHGRTFPAPVLSDGTLRFAAITAAFFQTDMPGILTIEEIENGIHASRLRLMVELLRNHASFAKTQIFVTTHSPMILAWLKPEEYKHVFFCKRNEESGEATIKPLTEIKNFLSVSEKQPIAELLSTGWLEDAI